MTRVREVETSPDPTVTANRLEWIDVDSDRLADPRAARPNVVVLTCVVVLVTAAVGLLILAGGADVERVADPAADASANRSSPAVRATGLQIAPVGRPIDGLVETPSDRLAGLARVSIGDDRRLVVRRLDDGTDLAVATHSTVGPPLPATIALLGAPNSTWLVDLEDIGRSGEISNTVRLVRLGDGVDSYGFVSTREGGETDFFVGSFWGPAASGLDELDESTGVFHVADTGIIASTTSGRSSVLRPGGFEPLPSRLGRIVAASPMWIVGVHCDAVGRCVGRIASWDGLDEREVDAELLVRPVVTLSPDGRHLVTGGMGRWDLLDLESGRHTTMESPLAPDGPVAWAPDSSGVFFVVDGVLVTMHVDELSLSMTRADSAGEMPEPWPDSDVAVITLPD